MQPHEGSARTTELLNTFGAGDRTVEDELLSRIRADLQRLAGGFMARVAVGHTLQPTALVHEAWLKLVDSDQLEFEGRRSFFRLASSVMRSVLVDHARASGARKRGGDLQRVSLSFQRSLHAGDAEGLDLLDLDEALRELETRDAELVRMLEMRFFGGLTNPEIAAELDVSQSTIARQWRFARAWLRTRLGEPE